MLIPGQQVFDMRLAKLPEILFRNVGIALLSLDIEDFALILLVHLVELVLETDHAAGELVVDLLELYEVLLVFLV